MAYNWKWLRVGKSSEEKESIDRFRRQIELFKNFSHRMSSASNVDSLAESLTATLQAGGLEFVFVYQAQPLNGRNLKLTAWAGVRPEDGLAPEISERFKSRLFERRLVVSKEHKIPHSVLKRILGPCQRAQGWTIGRLPIAYCSSELILVAGQSQRSLSPMEKDLFDYVMVQAATAMDKIHLLESAQASRKSKAAFLANISHEIRTPLNALIGFSEILTGEKLDDTRRQTVAMNIKKNGDQLTRLIDDVLDLSMVEAGDFQVNPKATDLEDLLEEVRLVASLKAAEKSLAFNLNVEGLLPAEIVVDGLRLKQILLTVIGNAIKFTQKGGVTLSVSWRRVDGGSPQLVVYIEDTGVGIPDKSQGQLFKPFSQVDETATRQFGGSGLGLALAARIAEEMDTRLRLVRSIRGIGTVFEILVSCKSIGGRTISPSAISASVRLAKGASAPPNLKGNRILLVEDAVDNQEIFSHFLVKAGAEVVIVDNGAAAVETAMAQHFHLTLMDIQIPLVDGKEATRQLRAAGYIRPIVALTAHALRDERDSCLQSGCDGQITKPVCEREFLSAVQSFLERPKFPQVSL